VQRVIVDVKTKNTRRYAEYEGSEDQRKAYAQLQYYMHRMGIPKSYIIAVDRGSGAWKEYELQYTPDHIQWLLDDARNLQVFIQEGIIPPANPDNGTGIPTRGSECYFCKYKSTCQQEEMDRTATRFRQGAGVPK
jgi:CRISPR/Cas system-associated exonuclease Cas4 (RecB family)